MVNMTLGQNVAVNDYLTCKPSAMFVKTLRITSVAKKPSGSIMRRIAESSSVRSNHWLAWVLAAFC
jgi:hypothetical protein